MDTPIRLVNSRSRMAFLRNIPNRSLQHMTGRTNLILINAIKWVLGEDFVGVEDRYRVKTDICSWFVASLLDVGMNG